MGKATPEEKAAAREEYSAAMDKARKEFNADIRAANKRYRETEQAAWKRYVAVVGDDI